MDAETLAEYRKRQEEKYKQRLEEEERAARAKEDEEVAAKLQADEQARAETAYATDEELARQLHEQMNAEQAPGQEDVVRAPDSDEVRAPLRTGYMEQLVPDQPHPNMNQTAGLFGWGGNGDQGQRQGLLAGQERGPGRAVEGANVLLFRIRLILLISLLAFSIAMLIIFIRSRVGG
uniref:Uncharacterized protein n=1 Tax=Chromera velia CCMP2878 TaxID=1169474 RepID=A0A0G4FWN4_9ALVE|eukprot:Cvel_19121.t1-p1 / transcript=Cvel_19121.t1 / gene=Cvel_19121 / organism=Chromera_velia_CCMP2878 / gene_product=hypothetical protein / transcript_product=hypothetical protein / location=Cvel_scaffold1624:37804-41427(-) / protein_length=176 / sequence_SO=supercontig / SO=protein_coding / is_pseudo=false